MAVDQRQHPALVHLAQLVAAKVAQLLLVDHLEPAIQEWLIDPVGLDRYFAFHQQARGLEVVHERLGTQPRGLELLAEFQDILGQFGRLVAVEQRLPIVVLGKRARGRVEAQ